MTDVPGYGWEMCDPIAFIAAMRQEIKPFLRRVGKYRRAVIGAFPAYRFELFSDECVLIECGIGSTRAMDAARALLSAARPRLLVSFGVAGAITDDLRVGDVVAVRSACFLDKGFLGRFLTVTPWSEAAMEEAERAMIPLGARLLSGTAVTTRGEQNVNLPRGAVHRPVLEMETAGIAGVASEHGVPLLALRSISDSLDEPLPFSIEESMDDQGVRIGGIIASMIRNPRLVSKFVRLKRNMDHATGNLVSAMMAALGSQLSDAPR